MSTSSNSSVTSIPVTSSLPMTYSSALQRGVPNNAQTMDSDVLGLGRVLRSHTHRARMQTLAELRNPNPTSASPTPSAFSPLFPDVTASLASTRGDCPEPGGNSTPNLNICCRLRSPAPQVTVTAQHPLAVAIWFPAFSQRRVGD